MRGAGPIGYLLAGLVVGAGEARTTFLDLAAAPTPVALGTMPLPSLRPPGGLPDTPPDGPAHDGMVTGWRTNVGTRDDEDRVFVSVRDRGGRYGGGRAR